jgi:DNA invertase Pin-like site-specific DNA recombinase
LSNICVIYTRISTSNKDQTSENQLRELTKITELKGLTIFDTFTDEGISGTKSREIRTGFDNLIKGAVKHYY